MGDPRPFRLRRAGAPQPPPAAYSPIIDRQYPGTVAGKFTHSPQGIILHGSRSGAATNTTAQEYLGTARYAASGIELGWTATVGEDRIALHTDFKSWAWNARGCSSLYLAVELAQANLGDHISDGQIRAVAWFYREAKKTWPSLPMNFPTHATLDGTAAYGPLDGKSDCEPKGSYTVATRVIAQLAGLRVA